MAVHSDRTGPMMRRGREIKIRIKHTPRTLMLFVFAETNTDKNISVFFVNRVILIENVTDLN